MMLHRTLALGVVLVLTVAACASDEASPLSGEPLGNVPTPTDGAPRTAPATATATTIPTADESATTATATPEPSPTTPVEPAGAGEMDVPSDLDVPPHIGSIELAGTGEMVLPGNDVWYVLEPDPTLTVRTEIAPVVWLKVSNSDDVQWSARTRACGDRMVQLDLEGRLSSLEAIPRIRIAFQYGITAAELVDLIEAGGVQNLTTVETEVAGFDGWQIDGVFSDYELVPVGHKNGSGVTLFQAEIGQRVRYYLADTDKDVVVIVVAGDAESFDATVTYAETLIDNVRLDSTASRDSC